MLSSGSPPAPQGIIVVNCFTSKKEFDMREKNASTYSGAQENEDGIIVYPFGGNTFVHRLDQGEFALMYRGQKGLDPSTGKPNVWTSLNGFLISPDSNCVEAMRSIVPFGVIKNTYDAKNPSTPQNGVAVGVSGVFRVPLNTDIKRRYYPGEYVVVCLSNPLSGPRTFPSFQRIPSQKILPLLRPLDIGGLKNIRYDLAEKAYTGPLKKIQLYDNPSGRDVTPFQETVHKNCTAILTQFVRGLEILAIRGDIEIIIDSAPAKKTYEDILKEKTSADMNKIRSDVHRLAAKCGLVNDSLATLSSAITPGDNHLQQDIFYASMWPHVPTNLQSLYKPNILHKVDGTSFTSNTEKLRVESLAVKVRKAHEQYKRQSQEAYWAYKKAEMEYTASLLGQVGGRVLAPADSGAMNPMVDILVGQPVNIVF